MQPLILLTTIFLSTSFVLSGNEACLHCVAHDVCCCSVGHEPDHECSGGLDFIESLAA